MAAVPENSLDRYDLLDRIAVGGMAEVFLAKAHGPHGFEKTLAIKRILPELAADPEFEERFIAEAKLAVQLTHANIVQVFDFGRFARTLFIAMEYVDGLDLAALLDRYRKRETRVPLPAAFHIAIQIARGLDFAHGHGVIHRDVSPSNILLSRAGEVKIADFGIALTATRDLADTRHRHRIMGKWRYMSPEQTRGDDLDTRSDLFAAGAVMYELFIGDKLFPGDEIDEIVDNIRHMEVPVASALRPGLPPRIDELLQAMLARDPRDRPERATAIQRALTEISYESSIVATALAVEEAVALVSAPAPAGHGNPRPASRLAIDDLILMQLGDAGESTERNTALDAAPGTASAADAGDAGDARDTGDADDARDTGDAEDAGDAGEVAGSDRRPATIVRTGVGADGVTEWAIDQRATADAPGASAGTGGRRWALVALALVAAAGAGAWALWREGDVQPAPIIVASIDAGPPDAAPPDAADQGTIDIASEPAGAAVWIDGVELPGRTPVSASVPAGRPHRIEIRMSGYEPHVREQLRVPGGQTVPITARLTPMPATLIVRTTPPGAIVKLAGDDVGRAPLERTDVTPGTGVPLVITKPGYIPIARSIELPPGQTVEIDETLNPRAPPPPPVRHGFIDLSIEDSWAEIYEGSRKLGEAPIRGLELPAGRHRLRLYNPASKKERFVVVEVVADATKLYVFAL